MVLKGIKIMVFLILSAVTLHFIVYLHYCLIVYSLLHLVAYLLSLNRWMVMEWRGYLKFLFVVFCGVLLAISHCNLWDTLALAVYHWLLKLRNCHLL